MADENLAVLNGNRNPKFLKMLGAGTDADPHIPQHYVPDFQFLIGTGQVKGVRGFAISGTNPNLTELNTFEDIWDAGGIQVLPTVAETLKLVSDDANDTAAGTGVRTVLIFTLDENYDPQTTLVPTNGITGTVLAGTHIAMQAGLSTIALTAGVNTANSNIGNLLLHEENDAAKIRAKMIAGRGRNSSAHLTVPAGHQFLALHVINEPAKDTSFQIDNFITPLGAATIIGATATPYQQQFTLDIKTPVVINEKFHAVFRAAPKSSVPSSVTHFGQYLDIDLAVADECVARYLTSASYYEAVKGLF